MAEELREKEWEADSHMVFAVRKEGMDALFLNFIFSKTLPHGIALPTVGLGLPSLETPSQTHTKVCFLVTLHPVKMTFSKYITVVIFIFIHNC